MMIKRIFRLLPLLLIICLFLTSPLLYADTGNEIEEMLKEAAAMAESGDDAGAMELFKKALEIDSERMEVLWNLSVLYSQQGLRSDDNSQQESDFKTADEYADKCVDLHPDEAPCHFAKALSVGRLADIAGTRDRIRKSKVVKEHVDKAVEINPDFYRAWHLLGVWHTEVANLSRGERFAARALYGGAPDGASNEKAKESFEKAMELNSESILIHLDFARFYIEIDEEEKAIPLLEKLLDLEPKLKDDERHQEKARNLLEDIR